MAIYIHCPHCHEQLEAMGQDCTHCGTALPPGVLNALASALGEAPSQPSPAPSQPSPAPFNILPAHGPPAAPELPPPVPTRIRRPWLAAALSLLCGLGQLYNGQVVKGMVLIVLGTAVLVSWQLLVSQIIAPLLWLYAIIDAYLVARRPVPP